MYHYIVCVLLVITDYITSGTYSYSMTSHMYVHYVIFKLYIIVR